MDNIAVKYFSDNAISLVDMKTCLSPCLPSFCFNEDATIEEATFTVPSNATYAFSYYEFPRNKIITGFYNGMLSKLDTVTDDVTYPTLVPTTSTTLSENPDNEYIALHGNGFVFQNEDVARTAILRYAYIDKTYTNVIEEFMNTFTMWYYYLYIGDYNTYLYYTRLLSMAKENMRSENKNIAKKTRVHYGQIRGYRL